MIGKTEYIQPIEDLKTYLTLMLKEDFSVERNKLNISNRIYSVYEEISSIEEKELCNWLHSASVEADYGSEAWLYEEKYKEFLISTIKQLEGILPKNSDDEYEQLK